MRPESSGTGFSRNPLTHTDPLTAVCDPLFSLEPSIGMGPLWGGRDAWISCLCLLRRVAAQIHETRMDDGASAEMRRSVIGNRSRTTAAAALVCVIAVTAQGAAFAFPSTEPRPDRPLSLAEVRKELNRLYHDAEVATDAYNAAKEKVDKQSRRVTALAEDVAEGEKKLEMLKARAGAAARLQYQSGGLPPEVHLFLSDDPQQDLNDVGVAHQVQEDTKGPADRADDNTRKTCGKSPRTPRTSCRSWMLAARPRRMPRRRSKNVSPLPKNSNRS